MVSEGVQRGYGLREKGFKIMTVDAMIQRNEQPALWGVAVKEATPFNKLGRGAAGDRGKSAAALAAEAAVDTEKKEATEATAAAAAPDSYPPCRRGGSRPPSASSRQILNPASHIATGTLQALPLPSALLSRVYH